MTCGYGLERGLRMEMTRVMSVFSAGFAATTNDLL
jgi:hypothetical protein